MDEQVMVLNKLGQEVTIAVLSTSGAPEEVKIGPHGRFGPVPRKNLSKIVKTLAGRGHLKLRPVS